MSVAVLAMVLAGFAAFSSARRTEDALGWVEHTQEVRLHLEAVDSDMQRFGASVRGYLATGEETFLAPVPSTRAGLDGELHTLQQLVADNPEQEQRLAALRQAILRRFALADESVRLRREEGLAAASALLARGEVERVPSEVGAQIAEMSRAETDLLARRHAAVGVATGDSLLVSVVLGLLGLGSLVALMVQGGRWSASLTQRVAARTGELAASNRALRMLSDCNQALIRETDEMQLVQGVCDIVVTEGGYRSCLVAFADHDAPRSLRTVAGAGAGAEQLPVSTTWADAGGEACCAAVRAGQLTVMCDIGEKAESATSRATLLRLGISSGAAVPLMLDGHVLGALMVLSADPASFDEAEQKILTELAGDLAFGIGGLRARAEQARTTDLLAVERTKLAVAFDAMPTGVVIADGAFENIWMNAAALTFHGFASQAEMGERLAAYVDEFELTDRAGRTLPAAEWPASRAVRGDFVRDYDLEVHQFASGRRSWLTYTAAPVRNPEGKVTHLILTLTDITERKKTATELARHRDHLEELVRERTREIEEARAAALRSLGEAERSAEALHDSTVRARAVVEMAVDGIITIDARGIVESFNQAAVRIFGYQPGEVVGQNLKMLMPARYSEQHDRYLTNYLATGEKKIIGIGRVVEGRRKDGGEFPMELAVGEMRLADGKSSMFTGMVRDITDRKAAETVLQRARHDADAANVAKSAFLANMSHEIRTPMNAILGFAQLLRRDGALTTSQGQQVGTIMRSGEHLLALINDILEYSKIEAGRVAIDEGTFDLHEMLEDLDVTFRMRAEAKGLRLLMEHGEATPRYVVTDEGKLRQILQNLLSNAVKFTERGGVSLRLAVLPGPATRMIVEVEDTGPGVAPGEMGRLFALFEQTESGRRSKSGTGLGLSISRKFAELLGGTLDARSEVDRGSTFRLELPIRVSDVAPVPSQLPAAQVTGLEVGQAACRVLVADDEPDNRAFLEALLSSVGFEVRTAENGAEAVREFEAWRPHLILMDMRMPVMTGREAIERIRAQSGGAEVKILAVTASAFREDRERAIEAGADGYVSKPFRDDVLFEQIRTLLGVRYRYAEASVATPSAAPPATALRAKAAALPTGLLAELRKSLLDADLDRLLELTEQVNAHDPELAQHVGMLAAAFAYEELRALMGDVEQAP